MIPALWNFNVWKLILYSYFFLFGIFKWETFGSLESSTPELQIISNCFLLTPSGRSRRFWALRWGIKQKEQKTSWRVFWTIWQPIPSLYSFLSQALSQTQVHMQKSETHPWPQPSPLPLTNSQAVTEPCWFHVLVTLQSVQVTLSPPPPCSSSHLHLCRK